MNEGKVQRGAASILLKQALEGHYSGWQQKQREKMTDFVEEQIDRGFDNLHEPMAWGAHSVKFLTANDGKPRWMTDNEALDFLYNTAEEILEERGVQNYHIDHGMRDFSRGNAFVFFRLCHDKETSLHNWLTDMRHRTVEYVEDAMRNMMQAASSGDASVWAKLPSGRFANYLIKDEDIPVGLTRDAAVREIHKIVRNVLADDFNLPDIQTEVMGNILSGTWFKLSYYIPLPASPPLQGSIRRSHNNNANNNISYSSPPSSSRRIKKVHSPNNNIRSSVRCAK